MRFSRPAIPSRGLELLSFGIAALFVFASLVLAAMFIWRGMIGWPEALLLFLAMVAGAVPMLGLGYLLRRSRLKKVAELREYERILASLAERA
jgi:hypothetical protein